MPRLWLRQARKKDEDLYGVRCEERIGARRDYDLSLRSAARNRRRGGRLANGSGAPRERGAASRRAPSIQRPRLSPRTRIRPDR